MDYAHFRPGHPMKAAQTRAGYEMGTVRGLAPSGSWVSRRHPYHHHRRSRSLCLAAVVLVVAASSSLTQLCAAFNLDAEERVVFGGAPGSYFGYAVEFSSDSSR